MPGSNNLKVQHKVLCQRDETKICYILFFYIKSKGKSKLLKNYRGEGNFSVENLSLFFQC